MAIGLQSHLQLPGPLHITWFDEALYAQRFADIAHVVFYSRPMQMCGCDGLIIRLIRAFPRLLRQLRRVLGEGLNHTTPHHTGDFVCLFCFLLKECCCIVDTWIPQYVYVCASLSLCVFVCGRVFAYANTLVFISCCVFVSRAQTCPCVYCVCVCACVYPLVTFPPAH